MLTVHMYMRELTKHSFPQLPKQVRTQMHTHIGHVLTLFKHMHTLNTHAHTPHFSLECV